VSHAFASAGSEDQNDLLSVHNFEQIAKLVNRYAGIQLPASKKHMVEGRLRKRARVSGRGNIDDYCRYILKDGGFDAELPHLIDVMTTNKTDFFREPDHFECLVRVVPGLLKSRRGGETLKVWSAACSNGAEPYTIAMVLSDMASSLHFKFAILATDICTKVLEEGRRAVYSKEIINPVPADYQRHYVMRSRQAQERVRIIPELRRQIRFERLNLMDDTYPVDRDVDVIFLRNVLIYFDKAMQHRVMLRLIQHLRPGGYIFVGHSESMVAAGLNLHQMAPAVFRKTQ
jgi:chemotaxis protein methyltransferase CheR